MTTTYYHISLEIDYIINDFQPRIPSRIHELEDEEKERICLSKSISGSLSSVPWGGVSFENTIAEFYDLNDNDIYIAFRVYEFSSKDIKPHNLIDTDDLLKQGLVMDACNTDEVWVQNQSLKPTKSYIALLNNFNETVRDIFTQNFYHLSDAETENIDNIEEWMEGCSTIIDNLELECFPNKEAIPYNIEWGKWEEVIYDNFKGFI